MFTQILQSFYLIYKYVLYCKSNMFTFIIILLFSLAVAFFAGQNTLPVTITLLQYQLPSVPLYVIIVGSMLIGFVVSWLVSLIDALFTTFVLRKKDSKIHLYQKKVSQLEDKIKVVELENTRLKEEAKRPVVRENHPQDFRPSIFGGLSHTIS